MTTHDSHGSLGSAGRSVTESKSTGGAGPRVSPADRILFVSGSGPRTGRGVHAATQTAFSGCQTLAEVRAESGRAPATHSVGVEVHVGARRSPARARSPPSSKFSASPPGRDVARAASLSPSAAAAGAGAAVHVPVADGAATGFGKPSTSARRKKARPQPYEGRYTVFESHKELLQLYEYVAAAQSYRSVMRVLKGIRARQWINSPDSEGVALCLGALRVGLSVLFLLWRAQCHHVALPTFHLRPDSLANIHDDLAKQAECETDSGSSTQAYSFAELRPDLQEAFVSLADLWREKVALDRAFLTAVYKDRISLLSTVQGEVDELVGSVSLQARETRRHYLMANQEGVYEEAELLAQSADHVNAILDKTAMCVRRTRHRIQAAMRERYADRDAKYTQAKDIIEEEEDVILQEVWNNARGDKQLVRECLKSLEDHVQLAYRNMQQRLLRQHLRLLNPMVEFACSQARVDVSIRPGVGPTAAEDDTTVLTSVSKE